MRSKKYTDHYTLTKVKFILLQHECLTHNKCQTLIFLCEKFRVTFQGVPIDLSIAPVNTFEPTILNVNCQNCLLPKGPVNNYFYYIIPLNSDYFYITISAELYIL